MIDSEEDEFDPNELKLLPVLATDRNKRGDNNMNQLRQQQKQMMKSSKKIDDAKFYRKNFNNAAKMNSSFYKQRGELNVEQLSPFRASNESKQLQDLIGENKSVMQGGFNSIRDSIPQEYDAQSRNEG